MGTSLARGRRQLGLIIAYLVLASLVGVVADLGKATPPAVPVARLVLTLLLCWFLWRGHAWARWLTAVLALASAGLLAMLAWVAEFGPFTLLALAIAAVNVVVAVALVRSRSIRAVAEASRAGN